MQTKDLVPSDSHTIQKTLALGLLASAILTANAVANADSNTNANPPTSELTPPSDTPTVDIPVTTETPRTEAPSEVVTSEETPATTEVPSTDVPQTTEDKPSELKPAEDLPVTSETSETTEQPTTSTETTEATTTDKAEIPVVTEKPKPAVEVPETNDTGRETILHPQETGTPTVTPTNDEPVITDQGYKIVDVAKSVLTLENADGSRVKVNPELVGGVTNEDGTVTIKNSKGGLETLPETGLVESMLMTFIGFLLLFFGFSLVNKAKQNNYTYL
jgi:AM33